MALPSSGPLTLAQIQGEFGGSNPISLSEYYAGGGLVPAGTSGTYGAVPSSGTISIQNFYGTSNIVTGQTAYTSAGTYTWVAPSSGVSSVSVVAVGGGQGACIYCGGNGGTLSYKNNISVTGGGSYTVVVGSGGSGGTGSRSNGGKSYFSSTSVLNARGGGCTACANVGTAYYSGGNGVPGAGGGGGGAGGYSGAGGNGGYSCIGYTAFAGAAGSGGAGGGGGGGIGYCGSLRRPSGGGGGVGLLGSGSNGSGGAAGNSCSPNGKGGGGGSSGSAGGAGSLCTLAGGNGGAYGGGAGTGAFCESEGALAAGGTGGVGAVRIIYPGSTRSFPSTNTGNL